MCMLSIHQYRFGLGKLTPKGKTIKIVTCYNCNYMETKDGKICS
jgi:hypothetical protein